MPTEISRPFQQRSTRLLTMTVLLAALLVPRPSLAQGPGWQLGEVDECQRKDIASDPQRHRWWKDAAPVELYEQVVINHSNQQTSQGDGSAHVRPHGPEHFRQQQVQLQRSRITGPQLWRLDQDAPAFDPTADVFDTPRPQRNSGMARAQLLQRLRGHVTTLSPAVRQRAAGPRGDTARLQRLLHKLVAGEAVSVLVIGGSVSAGAGQPRNDQQRAWVPRFFQWIRQTFPHGRHRLVNHAIGATSSMYHASCLPEEAAAADLVIVELTLNDYTGLELDISKSPSKLTFEQLVRKLLGMRAQAAVLLLHWWSPYINRHAFYASSEDGINTIASYYGVPWLSWRAGTFQLVTAAAHGYRSEHLYCDKIHPSFLGHRMLADLAIGWLQHEVMLLLHAPFSMQPGATTQVQGLSQQTPTPPQLSGPTQAPQSSPADDASDNSAQRVLSDDRGLNSVDEEIRANEAPPDDWARPSGSQGGPGIDWKPGPGDQGALNGGHAGGDISGTATHPRNGASGGLGVSSGERVPSVSSKAQRTVAAALNNALEDRESRPGTATAVTTASGSNASDSGAESIPLGRGRQLLRVLHHVRAQLAPDAAATQAEGPPELELDSEAAQGSRPLPSPGETLYPEMPPPMFAENVGAEGRSACWRGEHFRAMVQQPGAWEWVDEARPGQSRHKWGYRTLEPGHVLQLDVSTAICSEGAAGGPFVLGLGHLKSYEHMGMAHVRCSGGCTCEEATIDSSHKAPNSQVLMQQLASQPQMVSLQLPQPLMLGRTTAGPH